METRSSRTLQIMQRFNQAFLQHDGSLLDDLIAEDCVMENVEPTPDGTRYVGRKACLEFWQKLAHNRDGAFTTEDMAYPSQVLGVIEVLCGAREMSP